MSDDHDPPDFGLADEHNVGPAHIGMLFLIGAGAAWFANADVDQNDFMDWLGFAAFLVGSGLWLLDPPPKLKRDANLGGLVALGLVSVGLGWWWSRLPIALAGGLLIVLAAWRLWRRARY